MKPYYQILGIGETATHAEIIKTYRALALKLHPDKNPTTEAHDQFICIQKAYETLRDPELREQYDQGLLDEDGENIRWTEGGLLKPEDIEEFIATYAGSKAEDDDLVEFYQLFNGGVDKLFECVPLSRPDSEYLNRIEESFRRLIAEGRINESELWEPSMKKLRAALPRHQRRAKKEAKEFEEEYGTETSFADLVNQIRGNHRRRAEELKDRLPTIDERSKKRKGTKKRR